MNSRPTLASTPIEGIPESRPLRLLRVVALIAVVVGAAGSVGLMLWVGRRNPSYLLLALFVIWVLSPFVALVAADILSKRWPISMRATLYGVMLVLALGSLAIYRDIASKPLTPKPAFWFLVVPFGSWLLMTMAVSIAAFASGRISLARK